MKLIDKDALVAWAKETYLSENASMIRKVCYKQLLEHLDTHEVKEVDLDALGVLAEHLIACDAHLVTPKYTDKELDLLEGLANNKAQKGE